MKRNSEVGAAAEMGRRSGGGSRMSSSRRSAERAILAADMWQSMLRSDRASPHVPGGQGLRKHPHVGHREVEALGTGGGHDVGGIARQE